MTSDNLLAVLCAGVLCAGIMIGVAIGIVIKCGASTGGMDIPPLVINKKVGIPVSVSMYFFDFLILLSQMLFTNKEMVLYGILLVMTYTLVLDNVLVIKCGASTGGMDIPPLVINKKVGIPVSVSMYFFDFLILLSQMLFTNKEMVLYGILLVMTYTLVLDNVLVMGKSQTQVKIVSKEYEKINTMISTEIDRGTTLLHAETGYMKNEYPVVLTVISNRELPALNSKVLEIDPNAFMIVSKVNEVHGKGFTFKKEYIENYEVHGKGFTFKKEYIEN